MRKPINNIVITANGKGERMAKYQIPKFMLPYKGRPILRHLLDFFPSAIVLTHHAIAGIPRYICQPTESRRETLEYLAGWENVLIVDSDIIVLDSVSKSYNKDSVYKRDGINAGLYFVENISRLLTDMRGDDIVSGMIEPEILACDTIHLGTESEYEHHSR